MKPKPHKYRSQIRILADVLQVVEKERGNAKPTHILYAANLSHDRLMKYLSRLKDEQLVEEQGNGDKLTYVLTERGSQFLKEFIKISNFAEAFGFNV